LAHGLTLWRGTERRSRPRYPGTLVYADAIALQPVDVLDPLEHAQLWLDDLTRLAYVELVPGPPGAGTVAFSRRALAFFNLHDVVVETLMTDARPAYRSGAYARFVREQAMRRVELAPDVERPNGATVDFLASLLATWARPSLHGSAAERRQLLPQWLQFYNRLQPLHVLDERSPARRVRLANAARRAARS